VDLQRQRIGPGLLLNLHGAHALSAAALAVKPPCIDVNGDGMVTPLDCLMVIDELNGAALNLSAAAKLTAAAAVTSSNASSIESAPEVMNLPSISPNNVSQPGADVPAVVANRLSASNSAAPLPNSKRAPEFRALGAISRRGLLASAKDSDRLSTDPEV
jgi:hypothetical protein